jgi:hypothetical protein
MQNNKENNIVDEESPPPFLKTWNNLYTLVLGNLVVLIVLFYIFTKVFE